MKHKERYFVILSHIYFFAMTLMLIACDGGKSAQDRANAAIDHAITRILEQSASWQEVLKDLESELTDSAQSTIRTEVQNTLLRAEAAAGSEVRCIIDFIGDRVLEDLRQIRAGLTGEEIVRRPKICQVVPSAVDLALEPNRRNLITFDGYNFDANHSIQVFLIEHQGGGAVKIEESAHLQAPTHYQMTLNLGASGVQFSSNSQILSLEFNGSILSTISILQPQIPKCEVRIESFYPGTRTYIPSHVRGDKEFFGKVDINVRVSLNVENGQVLGEIYMKAEQPDDDHTTAEGTDNWNTGYVVDEGWRLDSIVTPDVVDEFHYFDRTWEVDVHQRGGFIDRYEFIGDTSTDEAGTKTKVTVFFNSVELRLVQTQNCTP